MSEPFEKHSRMPRKYLASGEPQPRDEDNGRFMPVPDERKKEILAGLRDALLNGETLDSYAAKCMVATRTLAYWCKGLGEEYREIRRQWIDAKLTDAEDRVQTAGDPFELAKGREMFKVASWLAERRDPERYADKRELTVKNEEWLTDPDAVRKRIRELESKLGIKTIEHDANEQEQRKAA